MNTCSLLSHLQPGRRKTFYVIVLFLCTADFSSLHLCLFFLAKVTLKKKSKYEPKKATTRLNLNPNDA